MQCMLINSENNDYQKSHTALTVSPNAVVLVLKARTWKLSDLGDL